MSWPVFGLTLGALIAGTGAAQAAGPVLPVGGRVISGSAAIGAPGAGALTVTQSSSKAILDWSGFSIGAGGKVAFDNGSGATLNRVTGASVSSLDGLLSATGSVYLINPNGVIIGKSGVVDVGGTFVASTLDTPDASFLKGGALGFSGPSTAQVVNLGKVGALGGDVALIAAQVSNAGSISAANGSAGLIAGHSVVMLRDGALDEGRFSVLLGGADTSVTNAGLIASADAELRAEGGNVYALAGDTTGVIRATGVRSGGGKVWLVAKGGELDLGGSISAQGAGGAAGSMETSGGAVKIGSARIDAHGGSWLVDPYDLTIDAAAASTIDSALNAGTSVSEQTTANGYSGAGVASSSGKGDITVAAPISWSTSAGLTLSAYRNINVNAQITASGGGALTLVTDNSGAGNGGTLLFNGGSVQFTGTSGGQPTGALAIGVGAGAPVSYTLVSDLQTLSADIGANSSGAFALAQSIDGSNGGAGYTHVPLISTTATPFTGRLEGSGNSILNLDIEDSTENYVGLFGKIDTTGIVTDLGLTGQVSASYGGTTFAGGLVGESYGSLSGIQSAVNVTSGYDAGGLAGVSYGSVSYSSSSGSIVGGEAGGLVGFAAGTISHASSSAKVVGQGDADAGGLVAFNIGRISESFSTGSVTGPLSDGGLVGFNDGGIDSSYSTASVYSGDGSGGLAGVSMGPITRSYASGPVSGYATGGLVGQNINSGTVSNSYFDSQTTGQTSDGGGATGLTTAQFMNASSPISNLGLGATPGGSGFVIVDSDGTLNGSNGATRPILLSEYSTTITNAHQLQLMALNLSATYTLAANIDASGTSNPSDIWSTAGFVPVGSTSTPFTGTLDGQGSSISNLVIASPHQGPQTTYVGLFADTEGTVTNLNLVKAAVTGGDNGVVGAVAGLNEGVISNVSVSGAVLAGENGTAGGVAGANSGTISGAGSTAAVTAGVHGDLGGVVGDNTGTVSQSYATGFVSADYTSDAGGLAGYNDGAISQSYASGAVVVSGLYAGSSIGGLVGRNNSGGQVGLSYATGAVTLTSSDGTATGNGDAGGLAGDNIGTISSSYATGAVTGASDAALGGVVGFNYADYGGTIVDSYWDTTTSGRAQGVGSPSQAGVNGLTTAQFTNPTSFTGAGWSFGGLGSGANWVVLDSDNSLNGSNGATRPILLSEYSTTITNAHQLQLMALDPRATYTLAANIVASGTANPSDVWGLAGFVPVGQASAPFTGTLNGAGHTVTSLTINDASGTDVGLIGDLGAGGVVKSLTLSGNVTGGTNVGALVGYNSGRVTGSSGKGSVSGASNVGGVVGYNSALVSGSYGKATVTGTGTANASPSQNVGGFVGLNSGSLTGDYATGAVTGEGSVGGLAGSNTGTISNSYATGAVSSVSGKSFLQNSLGGLVGSNSATLTDDYASGAVSGDEQVGGLVGYNSSSGVISIAYATGAAKGLTGNGVPSGSGVDVGGLVGENAGSAANTYATGAVSGSSGKGGLVGVNNQGATVATSYATGKAGFGFAGTNNGTLISDVFDTNTTGTSTGVGSGSGTGVTGIGGSTGLDPHQASSYSGFDLSSTWTIQAGSSRLYLIAIPEAPPPT